MRVPGTKQKQLPESLRPIKLKPGVYFMPYVSKTANSLLRMLDDEEKQLQIYLVDEPLTVFTLLEEAKKLYAIENQ